MSSLHVRQFPGISLHFLSVHFRFSSLHFLERRVIRTPFPSFFVVPVTSTSLPISRQFPAQFFISLQFLLVSNNFQQFLFVPISGSLHVLPLHFPAFWFLSSALFIFVQFLSLPFRSLPVTPVSLHFPFVVCNFQPLVSHRQHA